MTEKIDWRELEQLADIYQRDSDDTPGGPWKRDALLLAEALRLKARLDWLWTQPRNNIWKNENEDTWSATANHCFEKHLTPIAAIDALKAKIESQPAPEPPHEHEFGHWYWKEEIGEYVRACGNLCVAEFADALVPATDASSYRPTGAPSHSGWVGPRP